MSTLEKLFVQIFDRKQRIIDRVKHQTHLFDQHLASKLLIDGIAPPPWLWPHPLHAQPSDLKEFNKEELLSGVLLPQPPPTITYSSSHCSLYNKPVFASDNGQLPNEPHTQVHASDEGFDAGDGPSSLQQRPDDDGCASSGVPELDHTAMSPQDPRDMGVPDIYHDQALSLARIHRSKSRQRAIELRNSAKAANSCSSDENNVDTFAGGISGSAIASLQNDQDDESVFVNPMDITTARFTEKGAKVGDCWSMGNGSYIYSGRMTRSVSSSQQLCSLNVNKSYISREDGGILTGSTSNLNEQSCHENELLELIEPANISNKSCEERKAKRGDDLRKDMGSNVYLRRVTRSRNSRETRCSSKSINLDSSCDNNKADDLSDSKEPCIYVYESVELVNPSAITIDSSTFKKIMVDCQRKEEGCNAHFGRDLRSRSSCQSLNNVNGTSEAQSVRKSSKLHQSPSWIGDAASKNGQAPQMYDARSSLSQQDQDLCGENAREHSSKGDSEVKCVARNTESQATSNIKIIPKAVYSNAYNQRVTRSRVAASSKSNEIQGAQMSAGRSLPSQKDRDPCTINATCYSDKENVADAFAATDIKGETTSTSEGISKPLNSSHALGFKVTHSRSNSSNKPPIAQSIDISEGIDLNKGPRTQIKVLPCIGTSDTVGLERCAVNMMESEIDSDEFIDAGLGCPGSNMDIACLRVGSDVLVMRPPSDSNMLMKPKQLNFVDVDESGLNGISCPASEKEVQGRSSEAFANPAELMEKVAFVSHQARCSISPGKHLPEEQEDLSNENEPQESSSKVPVEETYEASGFSDGNAVSLLKKPSEVPKDAAIYTFPESGGIYQEKSSLLDHSSISRVTCEDSIRSLPKLMNSNLSNVCVDTRMDLSYEKVVVEHDDGQSTKLVSEDDRLDSGLCGDPKKSTDANFAIVSGSSLFNDLDVSLTDSTVDIPCPLLVDDLEQQIIHSGNSQNGNADSLGRCISEEKLVVGLKSTEDEIAKIAMPRGSFSLGSEDLGPQHKRRKIEGQLTSVLSTSSGSREEGVELISRYSISENLNDAEDNPKAVLDSQYFSSSLEEGVAQLDISKSLVEEMRENEEGHMVEGSESSPRLQVEEAQLSLEAIGGSANMPFTFVEDGLRMSLISSLIDQAAGDSQGCLTEEMEEANSNGKIFDSRLQCIVDQIPLEDKLGLGSTEHFTCSERTLQENISKFKGPDKFSSCSVVSPCSHSLDMAGADEAVPVFEGFILQTDDKQPCIAGEGFNLENFDLPNTAIERASILEQLCRSACTNTPLSCSSAAYKLHTIPSLYSSVPNGLLEGMDLRSNLSTDDTGKHPHGSWVNEEFGRAFHGRSYSHCPPNSSCQSDWNIRNPYTSPVGKLWDRIKSNSGSSEKRTSLNPELPCINEDNENADEVAETIPEGIRSEVTTSSVKREPLLDITENPNPPASVSEVEMYGDRCSLDSVNMEFSFTGTHTRVKQKLRNQHSRKKRYVNKAKENQSVSIGVSSVTRATESVRDRFIKPKLSGKTSTRKGSPTFLGRESKPNNIVSNITSFIPLVQQKQAATAITGKRDIKVKALEAAEAAKRLAEKKENERKMKKEALKLERARLEQENLRQLVLQKKRKEEEKKKKEVDMAAKKRQREEEERKEKERKRKRVEVSRRRQQDHEKLCGEKDEKELKYRATDTRKDERKENKDETDKHKKMESIREADNPGKVSETEHRTTRIPSSDTRKESNLKDSEGLSNRGNNSKVTSSLNKAIESDKLFTNTKPEQSYDISPYKVSDDEDEDEDDDDAPNSKFIPSWASKQSVALVVSSQQRVDPEAIFPPESFSNIAEVLLPRKLQLK
ncbi:uncharacterized protein LOC121235764 [Juglans microcarpa x Juglans regia]|uniref:uncharacterized protein LOC121235764 n=1 Tax=Juglans microcarpa x Juglans regia TaxID=2249226 RepID=UPI001B7F352C|nr:uncharacterized protein LOC121235764 [Juglans microcarpa x Juglans regia]XP_040988093.1 uncharacterized protein LOC121235764 [Juglans microcarpa x Juglans regia]